MVYGTRKRRYEPPIEKKKKKKITPQEAHTCSTPVLVSCSFCDKQFDLNEEKKHQLECNDKEPLQILRRTMLSPCSDHFNHYTRHDYHYRLAESLFYKGNFYDRRYHPIITSIEYVFNAVLVRRYQSFVQSHTGKETFTFHGTHSCNIHHILQNGFLIGGKNGHPARNGQSYGVGVYSSEKSSSAIDYVADFTVCNYLRDSEFPTRIGSLLLCKTFLTPDSNQRKFSQHQPFHDIIVSPSVDQILPCYIVNFKFILSC